MSAFRSLLSSLYLKDECKWHRWRSSPPLQETGMTYLSKRGCPGVSTSGRPESWSSQYLVSFFFFYFVLPKRGFVFLSCHKVSINTPRANTKRSTEMCLDSVAQMQPSKLHGGLFDNPAVVMQVIGGEGVGGLQRCLRDWLCTDALRL